MEAVLAFSMIGVGGERKEKGPKRHEKWRGMYMSLGRTTEERLQGAKTS
jgi:hypothetical protein